MRPPPPKLLLGAVLAPCSPPAPRGLARGGLRGQPGVVKTRAVGVLERVVHPFIMTEKPNAESLWHSCSSPAGTNTAAAVAKTDGLPAADQPPRQVRLRSEHHGDDHRYLDAYVDEAGLHIDGQDLGPGTAPVSDDGEYEWFRTIAPADIPSVVALLDGKPGEDILDLLERDWTAPGRSYELERRLRESNIPSKLFVWS